MVFALVSIVAVLAVVCTGPALAGPVRPPPPLPAKQALPPAPLQDKIAAVLERRKAEEALKRKQAEIESLLSELTELESRPSVSMDECAHWFEMSLLYREKAGPEAPARESEQKRKDECDSLYKLVEETREKMKKFASSAHESEQGDLLLHVSSLVHDYLDMKYATSLNEQLAKELDELAGADEQVQKQVEEMESFLSYMREAVKPAEEDEQTVAAEPAAEEAAAEATEAAEAPEAPEAEAEAEAEAATSDKNLNEVDATLRSLVDREAELGQEELEKLAELGGHLDQALSEGAVPVNSGKFLYLSGTLSAVRAVMLNKMIEASKAAPVEGEAAPEAEAEAAAEATEQPAEEEEAKKAEEAAEGESSGDDDEDGDGDDDGDDGDDDDDDDDDDNDDKEEANLHGSPSARFEAIKAKFESMAAAHASGDRAHAQSRTRGNSATAYSHAHGGGFASAYASSG